VKFLKTLLYFSQVFFPKKKFGMIPKNMAAQACAKQVRKK
jgi:hypothetical protein